MSKGKTPKNNPQTRAETTPFAVPKWLPLTLILLATALLRLQFLDIPLERDESIYSYIGKLALNGGKPYVDFYEMKPPVLFYSYAVLVGLFGYSAFGIHLAATVVTVANTFFVYRIAQKLGGTWTANFSAIAYALWSLAGGVYGVYLMSENLQVLLALPVILLSLSKFKSLTVKQLLVIGFLSALSFMVKQTSGVLVISLGLYWLSQWFFEEKETRFGTFFKPILWPILGFIAPIIVVILGLWAIGSGPDAAFWLLEYPRLYATNITETEAAAAFGLMRQLVFTGYEGYFIAAVLGVLAVSLSKKSISEKVLIISWAVLTTLTVALGQRFYGHYWLFALPVLSILGGLFFEELRLWLRQKMGGTEATIALIIGFLWSIHLFFTQNSFYLNPSVAEISRTFSPGNPYLEHQVLSNYLQKIIGPNDHVAVLGSDPQYFIYLNKTSQIRHVYAPIIANGQFEKAVVWQDETIESFKNTKPEYVILNNYAFAWMYKPNANQHLFDGLYQQLRAHYALVAYIENPAENPVIDIKKPINGYLMPTALSYIAVLKRREE
jgi:hypothetical protein